MKLINKAIIAGGLGLIAFGIYKASQKDPATQIAAGELVNIVGGGGPHGHHGHHGGRGRGGWGGGFDGYYGAPVVLAGSDWCWDPVGQAWVLCRPTMTAGQPGADPGIVSQTGEGNKTPWNPPPAPRVRHPMTHSGMKRPYRFPT